MKDLHEGRLFWQETLPDPRTYPALAESCEVDVAIVGGGMSGAISGYVLAHEGLNAVLVERGDVGGGSSQANTGLLQFCNDVMLTDLIGQIGDKNAVLFYQACATAVSDLCAVAEELGTDTEFRRTSSLYYASSEQDVPQLRAEYEALRANGFDVEYWEPERIFQHFSFRKAGAIVAHGDAEVNPFRFVHALIDAASSRHGLAVHEHTDIVEHVTDDESGLHRLRTSAGATIRAKHVIYAVGYEPEELRGKLIRSEMNRTSVIVTKPQPDLSAWHGRYMIWETARPYFYLRTGTDHRVIAGGYDEVSTHPLAGRESRSKFSDKLAERVKELFPSLDTEPEYEWNALFAVSRDNLPFIGEDPQWPRVYYCLGYGGNGTVYSMMGAGLLLDRILGRNNPIAAIVGLDRPSLQSV